MRRLSHKVKIMVQINIKASRVSLGLNLHIFSVKTELQTELFGLKVCFDL